LFTGLDVVTIDYFYMNGMHAKHSYTGSINVEVSASGNDKHTCNELTLAPKALLLFGYTHP